MPATIEERRKWLENRLKELDTRIHEIEDEMETHNSRDWNELALEREEDEVLQSMGTNSQAESAKIWAALQRIDEGEFGFCVECGKEISQERLDVVPYTPFCRTCAANHPG